VLVKVCHFWVDRRHQSVGVPVFHRDRYLTRLGAKTPLFCRFLEWRLEFGKMNPYFNIFLRYTIQFVANQNGFMIFA